jgi:hypothetical protein
MVPGNVLRSGRRAGIGTLAALAAGALARGGAEQADAKSGRKQPRPEGPCGNGSQKANTCKKNSECCTGYCHKGLCRGAPLGKKCTSSQTCRGNAVCTKGKCARVPACDAQTCSGGCCDGSTCVVTAGQTDSACGNLAFPGAACAVCTSLQVCVPDEGCAVCGGAGASCFEGVDAPCCAGLTCVFDGTDFNNPTKTCTV